SHPRRPRDNFWLGPRSRHYSRRGRISDSSSCSRATYQRNRRASLGHQAHAIETTSHSGRITRECSGTESRSRLAPSPHKIGLPSLRRKFLFAGSWLRKTCGRLEPVSHPRLGPDIFRLRGIAFNLLAQLVDNHTKILSLFAVFRAPHRLKQPAMCKR